MLIRQSFYKTLESLSTVSLSIPMDLACGRLQQIVVASATAWELFWSNSTILYHSNLKQH